MQPYTEPLQQSSGLQRLLPQRNEDQPGLAVKRGSVQQLQRCEGEEQQQEQQRHYDERRLLLLHDGGRLLQQSLEPHGSHAALQQQPQTPRQKQQQQQPLEDEQEGHDGQLGGQQERPRRQPPTYEEEHRAARQQLQHVQQQPEPGVEQQLVRQYFAALKSDDREPLLQQMGEFLCRWQQWQQQQQQPDHKQLTAALEERRCQLRQSPTFEQQVENLPVQQLEKQQLLLRTIQQQRQQEQQLHAVEPLQAVPLQQHPQGELPFEKPLSNQQSPRQQQLRPQQQQQRTEPQRAKRKLQTPSRASPIPRASATATPADAEQQQQQQGEEAHPPQKRQTSVLQQPQPSRRRQQSQQQEREADTMGRRITPSSPAVLLCTSASHETQEAGAGGVACEAPVTGNAALLPEDAAAAAAAAGLCTQQLQRKRGVRSSSSKTSRLMQPRQQQRQPQRPQRQHRQQQQQRQHRQQLRQQMLARGSPSPTRGRPGGQRFDLLKPPTTYSSANVLLAAGGETGVAAIDRKGSAGGGRPLWSPEAGSGGSSCSGTAPGTGVVLQQQTPQRTLQQQQLALLQQYQHPHDQHARHGTYGIVARGVRERLKSRADADSGAAAPAGTGEAGDSASSTPGSTAASGRRGKHCRTALLQRDRPYVCLSCKYRDPFLTLSPDQLEVTGHKGWSSVLATHCAEKGRWYFEVEILRSETSKLRFLGVGWACRYQKYDIPIGCNQFSFALTETSEGLQLVAEGLKRPLPAAARAADGPPEPTRTKDKDIIGCFLELQEPKSWQPDPRKDHKLYEFLQAGILCNPEAPPPLVIDEGAWIEFSVNGKRLGRAFQKEIGSGAYHPSISLYMGAKLRFNPGPEFAFPPDVSERFQACSGMRRPYIL